MSENDSITSTLDIQPIAVMLNLASIVSGPASISKANITVSGNFNCTCTTSERYVAGKISIAINI